MSAAPSPDDEFARLRDAVIRDELPRIVDEVTDYPEIAAGLERAGLTDVALRNELLDAADVVLLPADHLLADVGKNPQEPWRPTLVGLVGLLTVLTSVFAGIGILLDDLVPSLVIAGIFVVGGVASEIKERRRARVRQPDTLASWRRVCIEDGVLPYARRIINEHLALGLRTLLMVAPGFASERETSYAVRTESVRAFVHTLRRLPTGAIGIAGPRGVGKTTLITSFAADDEPAVRPLRVTVSAPVQYEPRDFLLHLFATVCRAVIRERKPHASRGRALRRATRAAVLAVAAVLAALPVTGFSLFDHWEPWLLPSALLGLALVVDLLAGLWTARRPVEPRIEDLARKHLDTIHYLRSHTSGWSGKVTLPLRSEAAWSRSVLRERRPQTYPELVTALCEFLGAYAADTHRRAPATIIAIDELDKISSAERAQQFINEIKSIFGAPGTQFLVSVSEDALASFERRGLPVRDAFDSAFDEIVRVDHLSLTDTTELVKSRVIGLPEPFTWLTHCMTGGLPRDVKRTARAMIALAEPGDAPMNLDTVCAALVGDDLARKSHAFQLACREIGDAPEVTTFIRLLRGLRPDGPLLLAVLPELSVEGELAVLSRQAAAYVYYSTTLLEVFRYDRVEQEPPETFEKLAQAKQSLAVHPRLAWLLVDEFRETWGLATVPAD